MKSDAEFLYGLLYQRLIKMEPIRSDAAIASFYGDAIDLPDDLAERVDTCLREQDIRSIIDLALATVRTYFLAETLPDGHLVLLAFLLWAKYISAEEACNLAQLDASHFSLITEPGKVAVLRMQAIAEEQRMGFMSVGEDDAVEQCLLAFCEEKGISFS